MTPPTQRQLAWRGRIETALRVVGPALDLVLAGGERISRAVDRNQVEQTAPPRAVSSSRRRVGPGDQQ